MRRFLGVSFVLLSMIGFTSVPTFAQDVGGGSSGRQTSGFSLEQNYPNPFNPETTIPFILGDDLFVEGRPAVVSMRIFNLLQQPVAVPVALRHSAGSGVALAQLEYTAPGRYEAFWDGRVFSGATAASGAYFVQLTVNGVSKHMKMFVAKEEEDGDWVEE